MTCEAPLPDGNRPQEGLYKDNKHYTPKMVFEIWQPHIDSLRGTESAKDELRDLIRLLQPPLCFNDLQYCVQVCLELNPNAQAKQRLLTELIQPLRQSIARTTTRMDRPDQRHPLFKTIKAINQLGEERADRVIRVQWLLALTQEWPRHDKLLDANAWYTAMLDIRTVLLQADPTAVDGNPALEHLQTHLLRFRLATIKSERLNLEPQATLVLITALPLLYRRAVKVVQFIQGNTFPGRLKATPSRKERVKVRQLIKSIQAHVDKTASNARNTGTSPSARDAILDTATPRLDRIQADIDRQLRKPRGSQRKGRLCDPTNEMCLNDYFTLAQDTQSEPARAIAAQLRRSSAAQAARNVRSTADVTCHTRKRLLGLIPRIAAKQPLVAIACLMSWTLGLAINRIENLKTDPNIAHTSHNTSLDTQTGILRYCVEHHPQGDDALFEIELPNEWVSIIADTLQAQPFKTLKAEYAKVIENLSRSPLERALKPTEWASSVTTFDQGDIPGAISAIKRGQITRRYSTSAHYLHIDLAYLATRLRTGWNALLSEISKNEVELSPLFSRARWSFSSAPEHQPFGSQVYLQLARWQRFYTALNTLYQTAVTEYPSTDSFCALSAFVRAWNLNQLQALWQQQFFSIGRPLGPLTQSHLYGGMLYHRDKASGEYEERKAFALQASATGQPHPLAEQHQALTGCYDRLITTAKGLGWQVNTRKALSTTLMPTLVVTAQSRPHLPASLSWSPQHQTLTMNLMTPTEVVSILRDEPGLAEFSDLPLNLFRHVVETECIRALGQNRTDMMLGHVHPGADSHGRDSSARFNDFTPISDWLNNRAKDLGIHYAALPMSFIDKGLEL